MAKKKLKLDQESGKIEDVDTSGEPQHLGPQKVGDIEIRSAKLKGSTCEYEVLTMVQTGVINKEVVTDHRIAHDDLFAAFNHLGRFLATKCQQVKLIKGEDIDAIIDYDPVHHDHKSIEYQLSRFKVTGFKVTGKGENTGIVLFGTRELDDDSVMKLEAPVIKYEALPAFKYIDEFTAAITKTIEEVEAYLGGKVAPYMQQARIDFTPKEEFESVEETQEENA